MLQLHLRSKDQAQDKDTFKSQAAFPILTQ